MITTPVLINGFDSVTWEDIPEDAAVVFYYDDGHYEEQVAQLRAHCPHAKLIPICVFGGDYVPNAELFYYDVEPGDLDNEEVASSYRLAKEHGAKIVGYYTSVANAQALYNILVGMGLKYGIDFLIWTAHYTGRAHLCTPACGFGWMHTAYNTQWTDKALGLNLDGDVCTPEGIGEEDKPKDPNHYGWYDDKPRDFLGGKSERAIVQLYDVERAKIDHEIEGHPLKDLRDEIGEAAARIEHLIETNLIKGKKDPNLFHRGWRAKMLDKRANGQRVAIKA